MSKFHINPETGEPGVCKAKKQCRFGDAREHFTSKEAARAAYEQQQNWEEDKAAYIQEWEKINWLTKDPMGLEKETPLAVDRTETPSESDSELVDFDEVRTYEAHSAMAQRINELLGEPLSNPVFIKDRNEEYWLSEATLDGDNDVTFVAGEKTKTFRSLAGAMQWLAHADKPSAASVVIPDFGSDGSWHGRKLKVTGEGMVPAIITPEWLYYDRKSGEPQGFYGIDDADQGGSPVRRRYFSFESVWVEEVKA